MDSPEDTAKVNTHVTLTPPPDERTGLLGTVKRCGLRCLRGSKENLLLILLLFSVLLGVGIGFAVRNARTDFSKREVMYLMFPGEILMRMLRMLILPLIISSLIAGIAGLDAKTCGKMGLRTIAYFATTTVLSVVLGIIMAISIRPGGGANRDKLKRYGAAAKVNSVDTFLDLIRNLFPDNLITACYDAYRTKEVEVPIEKKEVVVNATNVTTTASTVAYNLIENVTAMNEPTTEWIPEAGSTGQTNVLGIVMFSILFGIMLGRMEGRGKPILDFCNTLVEVTMKLFVVFIWYSPVGITFLIAAKIVEMEDFGVLVGKVGLYFMTVLCGLAVHGSLVLPGLYFLCTRQNPYRFYYGISQAMATAFGTSSSSATMPVTLHCLEHNNHVDPRVSSFVIPVGATINMDGTALYEAVAALFIAQVNDMSMDFGKVVTISITATAASIGAAGVPQAGLVTMVIVLSAVGLPVDDITLILVVDWFLDRFRTMINVMGDSLGAGLVYQLSKDELPPLEHEMFDTNPEKVPNGHEGNAMTAV